MGFSSFSGSCTRYCVNDINSWYKFAELPYQSALKSAYCWILHILPIQSQHNVFCILNWMLIIELSAENFSFQQFLKRNDETRSDHHLMIKYKILNFTLRYDCRKYHSTFFGPQMDKHSRNGPRQRTDKSFRFLLRGQILRSRQCGLGRWVPRFTTKSDRLAVRTSSTYPTRWAGIQWPVLQ